MKPIIKMVVGATITLILLASLLVPTLHLYQPEDSPAPAWQYDDYKLIQGVSSADGSLELKTVGTDSYVHAKDVGLGTLTYESGKTETINVSKALLDVIFMWGQSNAAYRNADPSTASPYPAIGEAYYFGLSDRSGPTAEENNTGMNLSLCEFYDMTASDGSRRIGDKAPSFCATYHAQTGHKVYWVNGAIGNKAMSSFIPPSGFMWEYGKKVLNDAIDAIDTDKFDWSLNYYLWVQGEANAASSVASYKSQFLTMHNAMLSGKMGYSFKACFISIVRDQNAGNASTAQRELCEQYDTIYLGADMAKTFTLENGLIGSDDLHYSQAGNNLIGSELAHSVVDEIRSTSIPGYQIFWAIPILIICALMLLIVRTVVQKRPF